VNKTIKEIGKTVRDKIVEKLVDYAVVAVLLAYGAIAIVVRRIVGTTVTMPGWVVAAFCALLIVVSAVAVFYWKRARALSRPVGERNFIPIPVRDEKLDIAWTIIDDPKTWIQSVTLDTASESYLVTLLDGPFHAAEGCHERLSANAAPTRNGPALAEECPGCGELVFVTVEFPGLWKVRSYAVAELQRLARIGVKIEWPVVTLRNPLYWRVLSPPK